MSHRSFALEKCTEQSEENSLELRLLQRAAVCVQMEPLSSGCVYFVPCVVFFLFNLVFRNGLKAVYDWAGMRTPSGAMQNRKVVRAPAGM